MIVTAPGGCNLTRSSREVQKRLEKIGIRAGGQDLADVISVRDYFQMTRQRGHVAGLDGQRRGQRILECKVAAHRVGSAVIKLNSAQAQAAGIDQTWV